MPDHDAMTPAADVPALPEPAAAPESLGSPQAQADAGVALLLRLLEDHDPADVEVVEVRARLAVAVAEAGQLEEAVYQADELVKDAQRAHGLEGPIVDIALAAQKRVREISGVLPQE